MSRVASNYNQISGKSDGGYPRVGVADGRSLPFQVCPQFAVTPRGIGIERQDIEIWKNDPVNAPEQFLGSVGRLKCAVCHLPNVYAGREPIFNRYGPQLGSQGFGNWLSNQRAQGICVE